MNKLLEQINKTSKFKLGKISEVRRGASPRPIHNFITSSGMPWIKIADVTSIESRFVERTKEFIKEDGVKHSVIVKPGDLILSNSATPGIPKFLGMTACIHDGWLLIKPEEKIIDKNYLYYKLLTIRKILKNSVSGAIFDNLKTDIIKDFQIDLPDLPTQKKIVSILSVYDEKIENNNKIIKNLEETAQTIFNEWFVDFKFPGYEKVKMVDSEMGKIPEGWEIKKISELFTVILGGTPSREKPEYWNGNIPWINSGEINKLRILEATEHITELGLNKSNARMIKSGATVLAITGATLGQVSRLEIDSTANQSVIGIYDENDVLNEYLYLYILSNIHDLISGASGGAQQHINKQIVEDYDILIPSDDVIKDFNKKINSFFLLIKKLFEENISLKSQRDLLLSKLI